MAGQSEAGGGGGSGGLIPEVYMGPFALLPLLAPLRGSDTYGHLEELLVHTVCWKAEKERDYYRPSQINNIWTSYSKAKFSKHFSARLTTTLQWESG